MEDNGILFSETSNYLNKYNELSDARLIDLEKRASEERRPIIQRDTALFLQQLVRLVKPSHILEIGTNFGYSALCMALASEHKMIIDTIEVLNDHVKEANKNFENFGCKNINCHESDAIHFLETCDASYSVDFVFIDANKSDNIKYVELITPYLSQKGLILVDNILWKGQVTGHKEIIKRFKNSTKALSQFNDWMINNPKYYSQILPIGDGLMMGIKK